MSVFTSDVTVEGGNSVAVKVDGSAVTQPVSGSVSVGNFPATQPISGSVTATQATGSNLHVVVDSGTITTSSSSGATATVSQVVLANNTNSTLLASNASRKSAVIYSPSQPLQIKFGAVASATSFTYKFTTNGTSLVVSNYTGQIDAFGAGQTVNVTEIV